MKLGRFVVAAAIAAIGTAALAAEPSISFKEKELNNVYFSEGAAVGDLNRDGRADVIYGPYWWEGPSFEKRHEIYEPKPQPMNFYADNFFTWVYDFNGDGWPDLLVVGLPNTPAFVFENPAGKDGHWAKHEVFPAIGNESPHFVDLLGSKRPVIVCTYQKAFGFVAPNWEHPYEQWTFHAISDANSGEKLAHGLGVGDLSGDGRLDVIIATGWFEQPSANADSTTWKFHSVPFTNAYGGAEMYAYDVNGDGKNDVITSLAAHDFGLAWYEQESVRGKTIFRQHTIIGSKPEENPYGISFSELHSVALADMDGDGIKDIITGKTYWSHHKASPQWDAGAVVYWFGLKRGKDGVDWIPHKAAADPGIGRQIRIEDVNGDKLPDILVGGMKGGHLLTQVRTNEPAAEPKRIYPEYRLLARGPEAQIDEKTGAAAGVIEGEAMKVVGTPAGNVTSQGMGGFHPDRWSGDKQLFWMGGKPGDALELEFTVPQAGKYTVEAVFTMARDYAIVQPMLDGQALGDALDLYNFPDVLTSGVLTLGQRELSAGAHRLTLQIKGANPSAQASYMVGLDFLKLEPAK